MKCNQKIAAYFNIGEKANVLMLSRLREDGNGPFVYFESYLHPRIVIGTNENFDRALYELPENRFNIHTAISKGKRKVRLANKINAEQLKLKQRELLLFRERFVRDPGNRSVEFNIGFCIAEKFTYSIEIRR